MEKVKSEKKTKEKVGKEKPTREEVHEWTKRDLVAASYFLNLLQRYPDVIKQMADMIYQHAMTTENGAAADHIKQEEHAN